MDSLALLRLMQLTDTAVPIGAAAHSFGLETLVAEKQVTVPELGEFLHDYIVEVGELEARFCVAAWQLALVDTAVFQTDWPRINHRLSALRPAREARTASGLLGKRLLQLGYQLEQHEHCAEALTILQDGGDVHHTTVFGLLGGLLEVDAVTTAAAYLQQLVAGLVSASQRLMPLGQKQAAHLLWMIKPDLIAIAETAVTIPSVLEEIPSTFAIGLDVGSMRHPTLTTRLFIS